MKLACISDTHLCRAQYGNPARRTQLKNTLLSAIHAASTNGCTAILCAGDLLDNNAPGIEVVAIDISEIDYVLKENHLKMFVTRGNHDNVEPSWWSVLQNSKEGYGIIPIEHGEMIELNDRTETVKILGYDYVSSFFMKQFTAEFPKEVEEADVVMLHGEILELTKYPTEAAVPIAAFQRPASAEKWPKAFVVGHIHTPYISTALKDTLVISPGATDIVSKTDAFNPRKLPIIDVTSDGISITQVDYKSTRAASKNIKTQEELAEVIKWLDTIETPTVAYVTYSTSIVNAYANMREHCNGGVVTLVAYPDVEVQDEEAIGSLAARVLKQSPAAFFANNMEKFIPEEMRTEALETLCKALLTPKEDAKAALDNYTEKKIGAITI